MTGGAVTDGLTELLLRQARSRGAPEWVLAVLEGRADASRWSQEGASLRVEGDGGDTFEIMVQLVPPPAAPSRSGIWDPQAGIPPDELANLSYIVVDEIVGGTAEVSIAPWPDVDDRGRLLFSDEERLSVRAEAEALGRYVDGSAGVARTGQVFAARVDKDAVAALAAEDDGAGPPPEPTRWLISRVYDIGEAARDKAKEAFFAAVAPTLSVEQAGELEQVPVLEPRRR